MLVNNKYGLVSYVKLAPTALLSLNDSQASGVKILLCYMISVPWVMVLVFVEPQGWETDKDNHLVESSSAN